MATLADTMRGMGRIKIAIMLVATILMLGFFIMLALRMSAANLVPLYTNLSLADSSKIIAELEKAGVPFELTSNGSQIMVPADRVLRMRMSMAGQGLPSGGSIVGYEIFDREETFGSSSFVININMMRAMEGELARTIGSLSGVDTARVHLVMPKRELFTRDKEKPSASITIKMRGGQHGAGIPHRL
jgi:flagellar M-ring protein FliF